jgi:hypothetical protein
MKNALEPTVKLIHKSLLRDHAEFCSCAQCSADVLTLALNKIRPRYVSQFSPIGEIVTDVQLTWDQSRAELTVLVYDAMRVVASSPRHEPESAGSNADERGGQNTV